MYFQELYCLDPEVCVLQRLREFMHISAFFSNSELSKCLTSDVPVKD